MAANLHPQHQATRNVSINSPGSLQHGLSRQLSKLLLDKFDHEISLTDQCLDCNRNLRMCIIYVEQASLGSDTGLAIEFQFVQKKLQENRLRLDIWIADCNVLNGPYLNSLGGAIEKITRSAFLEIHQQLCEVADDIFKLWVTAYGSSSRGEVYNNNGGVARMQKPCGIITQQLRVLAEMQTSIQIAQAIHYQIGPQSHLRKQIVNFSDHFNILDDEPSTDKESFDYSADNNGFKTIMEEKCDKCKNVFILGALEFHREMCAKEKPPEIELRPFEMEQIALAVTQGPLELLNESHAAVVSSARITTSSTAYRGSPEFEENKSSNESLHSKKTASVPKVTPTQQILHHHHQQPAIKNSASEPRVSLDSARTYTPTLIDQDDLPSNASIVIGSNIIPDTGGKLPQPAVHADQSLYPRNNKTTTSADLYHILPAGDSQITLLPEDLQLQTDTEYSKRYRRHLDNLEISAQAFEGDVRALQNVLTVSSSRVRSVSSNIQLFLRQIEQYSGDISRIDLTPQLTWLSTRLSEILNDIRNAQKRGDQAISHINVYKNSFLEADHARKSNRSQFANAAGTIETLTLEALVELRINNMLAATQVEIAVKENEIRTKLSESNNKKERKRQLETKVDENNRIVRGAEWEKERKRNNAFVSSSIGILGVVLAPFTFGTSLALAVGAGVGVGLNVSEIPNLDLEIQEARSAISQLQLEIIQADHDISALEEERLKLQQVQSNIATLNTKRREYHNQVQNLLSTLNGPGSSVISTFEKSYDELQAINQNLATCSALIIRCSLGMQIGSSYLERFYTKKYHRKQEFKRQMNFIKKNSRALYEIDASMPKPQVSQHTILLTLEPWPASIEPDASPVIPYLSIH